eukprot:CAMPEP_0170408206 /NCGR_PEP_ID=MMETSP0117_2-20130122/28665_1 /TAXON_ID=400756 /ORGANISM="Durinskia baltica, Strain CSIRO CS-38" /LENGTH=105 /DNA_ID=CAMNT_0010665521 /DNA_START=124 /DNA_END=441 /DNA_ORIENTATION=+
MTDNTRRKAVISVFMASMGLVALAFCSLNAGQSAAASIGADNSSGDAKDANESLSAGFGFAAFAFILAFLTFTIGGIYYSPLFCGSAQEKQEMRQAASAGGANQV